jgi:hypothetical protein
MQHPLKLPNPRVFRSVANTLTVLSLFLVSLPMAAGAGATAFQIGTAQTDITPPLGMPMAGYYHERGADGVLDPLYCKAMVLSSGEDRVAFVVLDIISITRTITDQARANIEKSTGIRPNRIMISATHAHTGPVLANRSKRATDMGGQKELTVEYSERLPELIAEAVRRASDNLIPVSLSTASAQCENLAYNRRFFMRDGSVGWNPGKLNPNIVMPAGPTDPEVRLLYAASPDSSHPAKCVATYVNFAMHPDTTGGSKFSADWPGALGRLLAQYHGSNHTTLVANGTCGNINHLDVSWKGVNSGPFEQTRIATLLGAAVFQSYKNLQPIKPGPLLAQSETVELALPEIPADELENARKTLAATRDDRGGNFMKLVRAYRAVDVADRQGKPHSVEVQAIAIGNEVAWVSLPGEIFVELGLAIKKRTPFANTFLVELANESVGYVPDKRSYAEGNYEPESARCASGSGEKLVEAAVRLLEQLHKQASAVPAKVIP